MKTIAYKLTDDVMQTRYGFQWALDEEVEPTGEDFQLCHNGCLHFYSSPALAAMMAPLHGNVRDYTRCFRAELHGEVLDDGTKLGARRARLVGEVEYPRPTVEQRVYFAIRCTQASAAKTKTALPAQWVEWAKRWVSGADRTEKSARAAAYYYADCAECAARAAYYYVFYAACAADQAAYYFAPAAACAADYAARAADYAADYADIEALAEEAMNWEG